MTFLKINTVCGDNVTGPRHTYTGAVRPILAIRLNKGKDCVNTVPKLTQNEHDQNLVEFICTETIKESVNNQTSGCCTLHLRCLLDHLSTLKTLFPSGIRKGFV